MITKKNRDRVERATLSFKKAGGRGVLVPGSFVLTAAHCISFGNFDAGSSSLGSDDFPQQVSTTQNTSFKVRPVAVENVADIAVCDRCDDQIFPDDAEAFELFCAETEPVPIARPLITPQKLKVYIFTHTGQWITGATEIFKDGLNRVCVTTPKPIKRGTSGSAIVNEAGELMALVSWTSTMTTLGRSRGAYGFHPIAASSIPMWVAHFVFAH